MFLTRGLGVQSFPGGLCCGLGVMGVMDGVVETLLGCWGTLS